MEPGADHWRDLGDRLRAFARRRADTFDVAEDIAQEAVARAVRAFGPSPADPDVVLRWSLRVARNLVVDHHRRRRPEALVPDAAVAPPEDAARSVRRELGACARRLVDRLGPAYRAAVTLVDLEGLPQQAVADRLGVSLSGAKSRVQRGRAMVRGMLLDCCRIEADRRGRITSCHRTARSDLYCPARRPG